MLNIIINNYLKNLTIDKAILIAKQFCIEFSYEEMKIALPYLKQNYPSFFNESSKIYSLSLLSRQTNPILANKCEQLINKLLVIIS